MFTEGEERLDEEMDILKFIKAMRTLKVLTSDKLARMVQEVKMSDLNVITTCDHNHRHNLETHKKAEIVNDSSASLFD